MAKPVNQQADPQPDSVPTHIELRQDVNDLRNSWGSRQYSHAPCIAICSVLVITNVKSARTRRLGPSNAWLLSLMKTVVNANTNPDPSPHIAAGWNVAASNSRGFIPRPASDSVMTPPPPIAIPIQVRVCNDSCSTIRATMALCTASVLEYAVPTTKLR